MNPSPPHDSPGSSSQHDEFLRLFSQYSRRIFEFIATLVIDYSDAEDLFQSTCVVLWKKFETYDPEKSFYSWACRIAYLEMLHLRRSKKRLKALSEEVLTMVAEDLIARSDHLASRQTVLEDCLSKLDKSDRELIEQRYFYDKRPLQISSEGDGSVHSIYRALSRVHITLRRCVEHNISMEGLA